MSMDLENLFRESTEELRAPLNEERKTGLLDDLDAIWNSTDSTVEDAGSHAYARDIIGALMREHNILTKTVQEQAEKLGTVEKRLYSKAAPEPGHSIDVVQRLNRIEKENSRLQAEVARLKDCLQAAECENANLCNENDGKTRKLKGANKKVRNAKTTAGIEEDRARDAVSDKQRLLASERKMRKDYNEARATLQAERKINEGLRAELEVERSGTPHMRGTAQDVNNTTAVIPIEIEVRRVDFLKLVMPLVAHQDAIADNLTRWYEEWKKPRVEVQRVVGAN